MSTTRNQVKFVMTSNARKRLRIPDCDRRACYIRNSLRLLRNACAALAIQYARAAA